MIGATSTAFAARLHDVVASHARRRPTELAVVDEVDRLTWEELLAAAERVSAWTRRIAPAPAARVAILLPSSALWVAASLGVQLAGCVTVSQGHLSTAAQLPRFLSKAEAAGVVFDPLTNPRVPVLAPRLGLPTLALPELANQPLLEPGAAAEADGGCVHFTSGSTGESKAVVRPSDELIAEGTAVAERLIGPADTCVFSTSPVFHSYGSGVLHATLVQGAKLVLTRSLAPRPLFELIERHRPTIVTGVPYAFDLLAHVVPGRAYALDSVRLGVAGGIRTDRRVVEGFASRFGAQLAQEYGLSEVGIVALNVEDPVGRPWSVGRPLDSLEVRIAPGDGRTGEVIVRSAPGAAGAREVATGDLGFLDADGFLGVTGRIKHMINVGGASVAPADVEDIVMELGGVRAAFAVAVDDAHAGERVALVASRAEHGPTTAGVLAYCREHLAPHEVPRRVVWVSELPRTATGKPDLAAIRRLADSADERSKDGAA